MKKACNIVLIVFSVSKIAAGIGSCVYFWLTSNFYTASAWAIVLACINTWLFVTLVIYLCNQFKQRHTILTIQAVIAILLQIVCFISAIVYAVMAINGREQGNIVEYNGFFYAAMMAGMSWISALVLTIRSISFRRTILNLLYDHEHGAHDNNAAGADDAVISVEGASMDQRLLSA